AYSRLRRFSSMARQRCPGNRLRYWYRLRKFRSKWCPSGYCRALWRECLHYPKAIRALRPARQLYPWQCRRVRHYPPSREELRFNLFLRGNPSHSASRKGRRGGRAPAQTRRGISTHAVQSVLLESPVDLSDLLVVRAVEPFTGRGKIFGGSNRLSGDVHLLIPPGPKTTERFRDRADVEGPHFPLPYF